MNISSNPIPKNWSSVSTKEALSLLNRDFKSEKHMCDVIEDNIGIFCQKVLDVNYQSHKREFTIKQPQKIDFLIHAGETIGVECKFYKNRPTHSPIEQMMRYKMYSENRELSVNRWVIVSTMLNPEWELMVKYYNLPFEIFYISKSYVVRYN